MIIEAAIDSHNLVYHKSMSDLAVEELPMLQAEAVPEDALNYLMKYEGVELIPKRSEVVDFIDNFHAFYLPALQDELDISNPDDIKVDDFGTPIASSAEERDRLRIMVGVLYMVNYLQSPALYHDTPIDPSVGDENEHDANTRWKKEMEETLGKENFDQVYTEVTQFRPVNMNNRISTGYMQILQAVPRGSEIYKEVINLDQEFGLLVNGSAASMMGSNYEKQSKQEKIETIQAVERTVIQSLNNIFGELGVKAKHGFSSEDLHAA